MKSAISLSMVVLACALGVASANASDRDRDSDDNSQQSAVRSGRTTGNVKNVAAAGAVNAPEISSGTMLAALTLLGGALVILRGRKARGSDA